jgi:hypothetical protein
VSGALQRGDDVDAAVRSEVEAVVEKNETVAELAPTLFEVVGNDVSAAAVGVDCLGASG